MAEKNSINMPGAFGGLTFYNEEFPSKFNLKPAHVISFVVAILVFRVVLGIFFPIVPSI